MKYNLSFLFVLLSALQSFAQSSSQIIGDTLISSTGYKIAAGQQIKLGIGTMPDGDFKYIRRNSASFFAASGYDKAGVNSTNAMDRHGSGMLFKVIRVEKRGNNKHGYVCYAIINSGIIRYEIDVDRAIQTAELEVPEEYRPKSKALVEVHQDLSVADELIKLKKLKDEGILTQEEFDTQKQKLLSK